MPDPGDYDNEDDFLKDCIPMVIGEGKDQKAAVGKCKGMWSSHIKKSALAAISKGVEDMNKDG